MDEVLIKNFMIFQDAVEQGGKNLRVFTLKGAVAVEGSADDIADQDAGG